MPRGWKYDRPTGELDTLDLFGWLLWKKTPWYKKLWIEARYFWPNLWRNIH